MAADYVGISRMYIRMLSFTIMELLGIKILVDETMSSIEFLAN